MRLVAAAALTLVTACHSLPFPDPHYEGVYGQALKKWTRQAALYSGLETRAFVRVVYMSDDFVAAQAAELSQMRAERPDQAAQTLARMRAENINPSVFAVVYVPDRNANDWNERESVWRLAINVGTGELAPQRIERIDRPFSAELRALYPYLDEYSIAYRIHFPDPAPPGSTFRPSEAEFIAAGALGKMTFHWSLDGRPEPGTEVESGPPQRPPTSPKP